MAGRSLSERSIDQLVELTRGWSVQDLGHLSVRVSQIRAETKHTPSVASLIKVGGSTAGGGRRPTDRTSD